MTIKNWSIYRILMMSAIGIIVYGCSSPTPSPTPAVTPLPDQMDRSPFTGIPCAAPCWHELEVGKSTESQVISVLPTLTFINQDSIQMFRRSSMTNLDYKTFSPGIEINASCTYPVSECLTIEVADDTLTKIVVELNYEIKPDEAIKYLGVPDFIGVAPIGGEIYICEVYLIWKNSRLALASTFRADKDLDGVEKYCFVVRDTGKIPSSLLISEVGYLSEAELNALMSPVGTGKFFEFTGTIPEQ